MKENIIYRHNNNNNKDTLIIIESGLSGSVDSSIVRDAEKYFKYTSDTLTIQYCNDEIFNEYKYQTMENMTMSGCSKIFDKVYSEIKGKKYEKLYYIGHSFQALTGLYILDNINKEIKDKLNLIFWDPTTSENMIYIFNECFVKKDKVYVSDSLFKNHIVKRSEKLFKEIKSINFLETYKSIKNKKLIVVAENAGFYLVDHYTKNDKNIILKVIKNSGHAFGVTKCRRELLKVTKEFILNSK
jgi:hypothetical protein